MDDGLLVLKEGDLLPGLGGGAGGEESGHEHGLVTHGRVQHVHVAVEGRHQLLAVQRHCQLLQKVEVVDGEILSWGERTKDL